MSDITKCADSKCPVRKNCWLWAAPTGENQAFADFGREQDADKCESYWPIEEDK